MALGGKPKMKNGRKSGPSALELLACMSGKEKMEPATQDAIEEIEAARLQLEKLAGVVPQAEQAEINSAKGAVLQSAGLCKTATGVDYKKRPPVRPEDRQAQVHLFEATHGPRWH